MSITFRYAFLALPLVVLACSEEIATSNGTVPFLPERVETTDNGPSTGPATPVRDERDAGKDAGKTTTKKADAGAVAVALPLGCATIGELEPNDEDNPHALDEGVCGTLLAADVDAFGGKSGGAKKTLRFTATGDAELVIRSFGAEKSVENGGSIEIPSFGPSLPFTVRVSSPTDAAQVYRIVLED